MTDFDPNFIARVNNDLLYRSADGREAWVLLAKDRVTIVTDIHRQGGPENAVPFSKTALLNIIELMEKLP